MAVLTEVASVADREVALAEVRTAVDMAADMAADLTVRITEVPITTVRFSEDGADVR